MTTPTAKSNGLPKSLEITSDYLESEQARGVADYIFRSIQLYFDEHEGLMEAGAYEQLAEQAVLLKTQGNSNFDPKYLSEFFEVVEGEAWKRQRSISDPAAQSTYGTILKKLFGEIETLISKGNLVWAPDQDPIPEAPVPNGSIISSSQVEYWQRVNSRGQFKTGLYRSGDDGVAATPYAAFQYQALKLRSKYLESDVIGGMGIFGILPSDEFKERYIAGVDPSLLAFAGSEQILAGGLSLREGAEIKAVLPVGIHRMVDLIAPIDAGVSLGKSFGNSSLVAGGMAGFYAGRNDVQDGLDVPLPLFNSAGPFASWTTPIVNGRVSWNFYRNGSEFAASLFKGVEIPHVSGLFTFSLTGSGGIEGEWMAQPFACFASIEYRLARPKWGVSATSSVDMTSSRYDRIAGTTYDLGIKDARIDEISSLFANENDPTGTVVSCHRNAPRDVGISYSCTTPMSKHELYCREDAGGLSCTDPHSDPMLNYHISRFSDDDPFTIDLFTIDGRPEIPSDGFSHNPAIGALMINENFNAFASALNSLSYWEKLSALNALAKLLYRTYDYDGLNSASGRGNVNSASYQEMYAEARNVLFNPDDVKTTSVCRGFAKFIAHLAGMWGLEAHAVGIDKKNNGHVIVMLREPGGSYIFVDKGNDMVATRARTALEALTSYAAETGLPPQLGFTIYDDDGKFERYLQTNEGRMLEKSTTPESKLVPFLETR